MSVVILLFAQVATTPTAVEQIEVKGQTPLNNQHGTYLLGTSQEVNAQDISDSVSLSLTDHLKYHLANVHINEAQNNPFQPDVQYRGFTASPLLGLPQGISVYLNGFRFNEPFGDTVNWDLFALSAIDHVELFSGSNPMFGYNTLGGALAIDVKNGFTFDRHQVNVSAGSHGSKNVNVQSGGHNENWAYYVNLNDYQEDGWRDASPSDIKQYLATLSYQNDRLNVDMLLANNHNKMIGNGAVPLALLDQQSYSAIYTQPDQTQTAMKLFGLSATAILTDSLTFEGNLYVRKNTISSINGDDSDYQPCELDSGWTICEEGDDDDDDDHDDTPVLGSDDDDNDDDDEEQEPVHFVGHSADTLFSQLNNLNPHEVDGTYNTAQSETTSKGLTLQLTQAINDKHQITVGMAADRADINFVSATQLAVLHNDTVDDDRSVTPLGLFDSESAVGLDVETSSFSAYLSANMALTDQLALEVSGRYQRAHIVMNDLIESGEGSLDGDHWFSRFNPAIGVRYEIDQHWSTNLSYSESSRNPSPAELSCADEDDPCKLPNGFVSDPPLEQVVVKTTEWSVGYQMPDLTARFSLYNTKSIDDIIFQQAGAQPSRGYFVNIEETRRRGVELLLEKSWDNLTVSGNYSYLDATFESPFVSFSPQNPLGANRQVNRGDTIPGQPAHQVKFNVDYQLDALALSAELSYLSSSYYRGDEANENQQLPSYTVLNLVANYHFTDNLSAAVRLDNIFDRKYYTFGTYGESDEVLEDSYPTIDEPYFVGPAKPRSVMVAVEYQF